MADIQIPKGWAFEVIDAEDRAYGWVKWGLSKRGDEGPMSILLDGRSDSYSAAVEDAVRAAKAWDRDNAPNPADPAWMVEVARLGAFHDDAHTPEQGCLIALRLALERGHVVEPQTVTTGLELTELARFIVAAECDKRFVEKVHGEAVRSGQRDDGFGMGVAEAALRTVLRGYEPRPVPSEEEMLKAAREDAAQAWEAAGCPHVSVALRKESSSSGGVVVQAALQARRSMLLEMGASVAPAAPSVNLEAALKRAWDAGWNECHSTHASHSSMTKAWKVDNASGFRHRDVASILSTLPAKE